jgi:hypothetical protein
MTTPYDNLPIGVRRANWGDDVRTRSPNPPEVAGSVLSRSRFAA